MFAFILRRLWQMLPTMAGVVVLVFVLFNWVGGDPAYILAGKMSNAEAIANIRKQLGVDQPYYVQLGIFVKQIVTFDFGNSWSTGESVAHIITTRLGPSLTVLVPLTILETFFGIALALAIAFVRGSLTDRAVMIACTVGMSISHPGLHHRVPVRLRLQARAVPGAGLGRAFQRKPAALFDLADPDRPGRVDRADPAPVPQLRARRSRRRTTCAPRAPRAWARRRIMWVHVLRNAAIPIITHVMSNLPALLIGAFLLERFFGIPGIGREVILAVERSDFPVIKAITVYVAAATMIFNLLTDLMYQAVDPRVQLS